MPPDDAKIKWLEKYWRYPYHRELKTEVLKTQLGPGKYDRIFGPYKYSPLPRPDNQGPVRSLVNRKHGQQSLVGSSKSETRRITTKGFESKRAQHTCKDCDFEVEHKMVNFRPLECKILIPNRPCYAIVRRILQNVGKKAGPRLALDEQTVTDLKTWIFTPTHGRSLLGNLNLIHNMVDEETKQFKSFVHVLVVQRSQFKEYAQRWKSSHVIIQLPDSMPGIGIPADIGRIGYARRFIQLLAEKIGMETVFMMDDNIPYLYDVKTNMIHGEPQIEVKDKKLQRRNVPLYTILKHIESQFNGSKEPPLPKDQFKPNAEAKQQNKDRLEGYTGPSHKYGVIGILRNGRYTNRVCNPFKNTHIVGLSFLNIKALQEHNIRYEPWPVWEDLTLNNDCDQSGLFVVKYNRFLFIKRHIPSWLPDVYKWDDKTDLEERKDGKADADRSLEILLSYVQSWAPPQYCRSWPDRADRGFPDMKALETKIQKKMEESIKIHQSTIHKHHVVFFYPTYNLDLVPKYLTETPGLGHFTHHVMIFPIEACLKLQLTTVENFKTKIIDKNFIGQDGVSQPLFEVVTSHNPKEFNIKMVLVYVEGRGKYVLK